MDNAMLNNLISRFGFNYDSTQGIFYSKIDAWQRNVGYFTLYDYAAPFALMNIDCEPIRFNYAGKNWKIEFWKGQYGICTGAEIGIYVGRYSLNIATLDHRLDWLWGNDTRVATERNWLKMGFTLKKNGQRLFTRTSDDPNTNTVETKHWWVTGFKPGVVSTPSELTCEIDITFKDLEMLNSFEEGLKTVGYKKSEYERIDQIPAIRVIFSTPYTRQPDIIRTIFFSIEEVVAYLLKAFGNVVNTYTIDQVCTFLITIYNMGWNDIASVLHKLNFIINAIYEYIKNLLGWADKEIAKLLALAGFTASQVGDYFKNVLHYAANVLADFLNNAGYNAQQTGNFIKSAYGYTAERVASLLKHATYGVNEIGEFLTNGLGYGADRVAEILYSVGFSVNQVGNYLKNVLNKTAQEIISILINAGCDITQIANYIMAYFQLAAWEVAGLFNRLLN